MPCNPVVVTGLTVVPTGGADVEMAWDIITEFDSYSVYAVTSGEPAFIPLANGQGELDYPAHVANICREAQALCIDSGAPTTPPTLLYYQVVGACPDGTEGPNN